MKKPRRFFPSLWVLATLLALGFGHVHVPRVLGATGAKSSRADSLSLLMKELRQQAKFAEALEVARQLGVVLRADSSAALWEIMDVQMLMPVFQMAAALPAAAQRELVEADLLTASANAAWKAKEYGKAGDLVQRQLDVRMRLLGEWNLETAKSFTSLAYYRGLEGRTGEAADGYRRALEIYRALWIPDHPAVAYNLKYLGMLLYDQGEYGNVFPLWLKRLVIVRNLYGERSAAVAETQADLGELLRETGDYAGAEWRQRQALAIRRALFGDDDLQTAGSIYNLAILYHDMGDYARAEFLHLQALSLYRKLLPKDHPKIVRSLDALAAVRTDLGEFGEAEPVFREVLQILERQSPRNDHEMARTLNNLAMLLYERADFAEAERLFNQALELKKNTDGEHHPGLLLNMHNVALCRMRMGKIQEAEALLREEMDLTTRALGEENRGIAECHHDLGRDLVLQGRYTEAEIEFRRALSVYRAILGKEHPYVALALADFAVVWTAQGAFVRAESLLTDAAEIYEIARKRAGTGMVRSTFQESPYWMLAAARLETGKREEAWRAVEGALGRALADLLFASGKQVLARNEAAREDSLKKNLGASQDRLAALQAMERDDSTRATVTAKEETFTQLLAAEAAWKGFQVEMAKKYPVSTGRGFALERVQRVLSKSTALAGWLYVEIAPGKDVAWGYVVRESGPVTWVKLGSPKRTAAGFTPVVNVEDYRKALRTAAGWPARVPFDCKLARRAKEIADYWFAPLKPALGGIGDLIVVPAGPLLGVPISSLPDVDGEYLDEKFVISYVPSATLYAWLSEKEIGATKGETRSLLVGSPVVGDENARLPWTEEEIEKVASVLARPTTLTGASASEQRLFDLAESDSLRHYNLIHFAAHARVDDMRPDRSALILSKVALTDPLAAVAAGKRLFDGQVTADEIVREWNLSADLVTLSGCQTALGKEHAGEGFVGFANAFLQAGARSLVTSLWRVEDESTAMLMQRFYENLSRGGPRAGNVPQREGMSKAAALREAQTWMRNYVNGDGERPFAHPVYWSGFVLSGTR